MILALVYNNIYIYFYLNTHTHSQLTTLFYLILCMFFYYDLFLFFLSVCVRRCCLLFSCFPFFLYVFLFACCFFFFFFSFSLSDSVFHYNTIILYYLYSIVTEQEKEFFKISHIKQTSFYFDFFLQFTLPSDTTRRRVHKDKF